MTQPIIKFVTKAKFEGKILVWIAIGLKGLNRLFTRKSGLAVNGEHYLKKYVYHRLIPYIRSNYNGGDYVLFPNLESSRYCNIVLRLFRQQNITFVEKSENPNHIHEIRPVERF